MLHNKKIALFISHIFGDFQTRLCQGIVDRALALGYHTEVYTSMDGENLGNYEMGEGSILRIPSFEDISGIIFASDTYYDLSLKEEIAAKLKATGLPVVELSEYCPLFPSVTLDNNKTAGELTRHLAKSHGCTKICFLADNKESFFSDERERYYREAMQQLNLPFDETFVFHTDESEASYDDAISQFVSKGKPDGVVCYNDRVALGFLRAALRAGYEIPKDFAITGCDFSQEGQNASPSLTTVTFPAYELGTAAVSQLQKQMKGESFPQLMTVNAQPVYSASCGCPNHAGTAPLLYQYELQQRIAGLENSMFTSMRMSTDFSHISDLDEAMDALASYVMETHDGAFYLCLYPDWNHVTTPSFEDDLEDLPDFDSSSMLLKLAIRDKKRLPECSFAKTSLLPDYLQRQSQSAYIVSPLYFEERAFGYLALSFPENKICYPFHIVQWIMNVTQLLQNICEAKRTALLTAQLENIYLRDALTGLWNLQGYHRKEEILRTQSPSSMPVAALLFDMDHLKTINDTYGHSEGDFALQVIGQAFLKTATESVLCARTGGDEFRILITDCDESKAKDFIERIYRYLENYNKLSKKPYEISVSAGAYVIEGALTEQAIEDAFCIADERMYVNKKSKTPQ